MSWSGKWLQILISLNWARRNRKLVSFLAILFYNILQINLWLQIVKALGTKLEKAFKDPIKEIKKEFGLIEENFFEVEEEQYLGDRSFPSVSLFITDKKQGKWVDTLIKGSAAIIQLKDVGAPIVLIRMWQENEQGDIGNMVFETEIPLNFKLEKFEGCRFTAISCL